MTKAAGRRRIRIAAISVATVDGLMKSNYARALELGGICLKDRPDIILFPEAFAAGYCGVDLLPYVETSESPSLQAFRHLSKKGACVVAVGFLSRCEKGMRNAVAVFEKGKLLGIHYKRSLWPDKARPYRDERTLFVPGTAIEIFETGLGRFAVLTCYENMLEQNWREVAGKVDFILSPYNCEGDPSHNNIKYGKLFQIPSAWADRTGTVYTSEGFVPNLGTAGMVDAEGKVIRMSRPGVEEMIINELEIQATSHGH